jgi:hypothetical protein
VAVQGFFSLKNSEEKFRPTGNRFNFVLAEKEIKKLKNMTHIPVPYKKFSSYAHDLEGDEHNSHRSFQHPDGGIDLDYDAHKKLVLMEDGTYLEKQDDNVSQHSRNSHKHQCKHVKAQSNMRSVMSGNANESWQCSSECSLETSKHESMVDLYEDPNALFIARILEDKLTDQFDRRRGKIPDMAEVIYDR